MRAAMSVRFHLPPEHVHLHAVLARAHHALQPQLLAGAGERLVGQHQRAALAGGHVLVGVEAEGDEVAEGAERAPAPGRAEGLRRVLDHAQIAAPREVVELVAVHRQAGEVHRDQRARRAA